MTLYTWSVTADDNATADSSISWPEGMAPSAVNNSARAMMAAVAKWRNDNAGTLTTTGTSTAYLLTTSQVFASGTVANGASLRVKFHTTNGAAPTLAVDSVGAKAIQTVSGTAIGTGVILANTIHDLVYSNAVSAWILTSIFSQFASGTRMLFQQTAAPTNWTKDTSSFNNRALRLVTGTASSGGNTAFTSVFAARTIAQGNLPNYTLSHTLDVASQGTPIRKGISTSQVATGTGPTVIVDAGGIEASDLQVTGSVTSGGSGTAMDFDVLYADAIVAAKD